MQKGRGRVARGMTVPVLWVAAGSCTAQQAACGGISPSGLQLGPPLLRCGPWLIYICCMEQKERAVYNGDTLLPWFGLKEEN